MADYFDSASQRQALDTVLMVVATEGNTQSDEQLSGRLLESVNDRWCQLTPEQKNLLASQESNTSSFKRNSNGDLTEIQVQSGENRMSVPLDCRPKQSESEPKQTESSRQSQIIETARQRWRQEQAQIKEMSQYNVQPGDGFDRIARNTLWSGNTLDGREGEVIENSRSIAAMNGFDRDTYDPKKRSLQPGQNVKVHDVDWQLEMMMQSIGRINDWVHREVDGK